MKEVSELTREDLLDKDVLFEYIDIVSDLDFADIRNKVEDRALAMKCATQTKRLMNVVASERKKALKQMEPSNQAQPLSEIDNVTEFDHPELGELYCGSFRADKTGVYEFTPYGVNRILFHPIMPVKRLTNVETKKQKIILAYKKGLDWVELPVDRSVVSSASKIIALADYGVSVTSENAKSLVRFLSELENRNMDKIAHQISTSKLGWVSEYNVFMPYGDFISFDNEERFRATYDSIRTHGSYEEWLKLVRSIRAGDRFEPKIYLAGALASVLIKKLNALPFIINLWGDSGKGKTVALKLAASVWANPDADYMTDPKSTLTALELRMDFLNSLPVLIDDMAQVKERFNGDFSELIYFLCSGQGKARANTSLGINKQTTWSNVILTNGEHSLVAETTQGGAVNRVIDVEMDDGYIFQNGNKVCEIIGNNYGYCGKEFVEIVQDMPEYDIRQIYDEFVKKINLEAERMGGPKEEKQVIPMAILLTADKIATEFIFQDGMYLDFEKCVELLKGKNEVSESERAYEFIQSEVASHINNFRPINDEYRGEVWGKLDKDYVYILPSVFNRICNSGNFSSKTFLSWAKKHDKIRVSSEGRSLISSRINGNISRCYAILREEQWEEISNDEELPFD